MQNVLTPPRTTASTHKSNWTARVLLILVVLVSFALVLVPAFLIFPFRTQTQRVLEISFVLRRWSPALTIVCCVASLVFALSLWPTSRRWWSRALLVLAIVSTLAPVWFARQNHFEWMFNPLRNSTYVRASDASFPGDADMVLAVKINNEAVAYPVRIMGYHHIVQDTVGGSPICATY